MIRKLARPLLASAFAVDGVQMLLDSKQYTDGAAKTTKVLHGVLPSAVAGFLPRDPEQAVRVTATTKVTAATLLGLGKAPRLAATVLTLIQIPTAVTRHAFWATDDAREKDSRKKGLVTDLALLGGLAITSADTAGAPGCGGAPRRRASRSRRRSRTPSRGRASRSSSGRTSRSRRRTSSAAPVTSGSRPPRPSSPAPPTSPAP